VKSIKLFLTGSFTKKMIFSTMVEKNYNGWVEADLKGTLKYWDKARLNYGLAIDVYNQDEQQLDARDFFHLQECQAGKSVVPFALINTHIKYVIFIEKNQNKKAKSAIYQHTLHIIKTTRIKFMLRQSNSFQAVSL
jgi:hypothetical protein